MKNVILRLLTLNLLLIDILNAQYLNVQVNSNSTYIYGEESVMINPINSNQIVAGVIQLFSNTNLGYYYTSNGGLNWSGGPLISTLAKPISDPCVFVDTAGNFYYTGIATLTNGNAIICFKSTNGGINWTNGSLLAQLYPKLDDMPTACVDFSNSQYRNNIYVTFTLFDPVGNYDSTYVYFCRSSNGANTFSTPVRIGKISGIDTGGYGNNSTPEGPVPCTGINGEVYVCFPHNEQVYFNRSTDAGNTWLDNDIPVSQLIGGWTGQWNNGRNFSPVIACDYSNSAFRGNIYICFSDLRNANDRDIWLVKSTNGGYNWSNSVRVNNDSPGHDQKMPWICVDQVTGYIWIVFYDSRNHALNYFDAYVARSTDGGNSFQNVQVSTSSIFNNVFGEYIGISAYHNKVRPVWTSIPVAVWTALIDTFPIGIKKISIEIPNNYELFQNYPNPFNPSTTFKFDLPKESFIKLIIYDLLGREVATLINEELNPGNYEVPWSATGGAGNYSSGVYFYKLTATAGTETFSCTRKLILLQ